MKNINFQYRKWILHSQCRYYLIQLSISFLLFSLMASIAKLDDKNSILFILIGLVMTPLGIMFAGGYKLIKKRFLLKYNLKDNEL